MLLEQIELPTSEFVKRRREMSHWNAVAKLLYSSQSENDVLLMLKVECQGNRRPYVIRRIYAHFNTIRRRRELAEVQSFLKGRKSEPEEAEHAAIQ